MQYENVGNGKTVRSQTAVCIIHCRVVIEICMEHEFFLRQGSSLIIHLKREPLSCLHVRFLITHSAPNGIELVSLKFHPKAVRLTALLKIIA